MFLFIEYPAKRRLKVNNQRKSRKYYHLPSDLSVMSKDVSVDAAMFLFTEFFSNIFSRLRLVASRKIQGKNCGERQCCDKVPVENPTCGNMWGFSRFFHKKWGFLLNKTSKIPFPHNPEYPHNEDKSPLLATLENEKS